MTAYKNFVDDFPRRCRDILNIAKRPALHRGREVTLTLMVASAGLVVPYERLKPDIGWGGHPSDDHNTFADAAGKLESLLRQPFMSSRLCTEANPSWRNGKLLYVTGDPDSWEDLQKSRPISKDKTVGGILSVIRNALAHGNTWTLRDPIEAIIFVKRVLNDDKVVRYFDFLTVSPHEFQHFLEGWFDFLISLGISQEAAFGVFKDAA